MNVLARRLPLAVAVLLALSPRAHADAFTVTAGSISIADRTHGASFTLTGDDFSLGGRVPQFVWNSCSPCPSTAPAISIQGPLSDIRFGEAPGRWDGVDYPMIVLTGVMNVHAAPFAGAMLLESTTVTLPFDFSATMRGFRSVQDEINTPPGGQLFFAEFSGTGTATVRFTAEPPSPNFPPLFDFASAVFTFSAAETSPTPEPATLLLVGAGAMSAFFHRRRRRTLR
jgi:hypothetical protein